MQTNLVANAGRWLIGWARRIIRPIRNRRDYKPPTPEEEMAESTVLAVLAALADPRCPGTAEILALIHEQRTQEEAASQAELATRPPRPKGPAYSAFDPGMLYWMREDAATVSKAWKLARTILTRNKEISGRS